MGHTVEKPPFKNPDVSRQIRRDLRRALVSMQFSVPVPSFIAQLVIKEKFCRAVISM